jgi:hypothetical protein
MSEEKETKVIKITKKQELKKIILSGMFDDSIQVKNTEHICKDGSIYDYSEITDLTTMFDSSIGVNSIPLFDTSNVINMWGLFYNCSSLTSIPLLNISNVEQMPFIFDSCKKLTKEQYIEFIYQNDKILLKTLKSGLLTNSEMDKLLIMFT